MSAPSPVAGPAVALALLIVLSFGSDASPQQSPPPTESVLKGRLATVEPGARRISLIPDESADRLEMVVTEDGAIVQETEELTLSDLVIHVGRRVTVNYSMESGVRIARSITVEPPPAG